MIEKRGSSGAWFNFAADRVTKWSTGDLGARVREQGTWVINNPAKGLPTVHRIIADGYEMEVLEPIDVFGEDIIPLLDAVARTIAETQQSMRGHRALPLVELDVVELRRYIVALAEDFRVNAPGIGLTLIDAIDRIQWQHVARDTGWTHGDPIIDNVMMRGDQFVLIDPIPPCPALPSVAVVDYGRLVQSALGYEQIRYRGEFPEMGLWKERLYHVLNNLMPAYSAYTFNVEKIRATLFYAIIHMLRGVRTAPETEVRAMLISQTYDLVGELKQWMR